MEAKKLKTVDDLLLSEDERVELIDGEILQRSLPRFEHGAVQSKTWGEILPYNKKSLSDGGWWIVTEVSVRYNEHQCPCHDLAGWRKERVPNMPKGIIEIKPDWVCEVISPGHENKDTVHNFLLLQNYQVPYYWIIYPEDKTIITYILVDSKYKVDFSIQCKEEKDLKKVNIAPFEEVKIDLSYVFEGL
jgi:Uma2 family endonuclease